MLARPRSWHSRRGDRGRGTALARARARSYLVLGSGPYRYCRQSSSSSASSAAARSASAAARLARLAYGAALASGSGERVLEDLEVLVGAAARHGKGHLARDVRAARELRAERLRHHGRVPAKGAAAKGPEHELLVTELVRDRHDQAHAVAQGGEQPLPTRYSSRARRASGGGPITSA